MMKKRTLSSLVSLFLLFSVLLSSCSTQLVQEEETTEESETLETLTETKGAKDPKEDHVLNVLMIGDSYCYYYADELYGLAKAAGIEMKVCNVYYSGCTLAQHWNWWKYDEYNYEFFTHSKNGKVKKTNYNLDLCLNAANWDVITLQDGGYWLKRGGYEALKKNMEPYLRDLLGYIREKFPMADMYWHDTWSWQIGFDDGNGYVISNATERDDLQNIVHRVSLDVQEKYQLPLISTGPAWKLADTHGFHNLAARKGVNGDMGDYNHDGDIGGGQYLNACVWFEMLTGQSCVGNTFRPNYELVRGSFEELQQIAHQAVEEAKR